MCNRGRCKTESTTNDEKYNHDAKTAFYLYIACGIRKPKPTRSVVTIPDLPIPGIDAKPRRRPLSSPSLPA